MDNRTLFDLFSKAGNLALAGGLIGLAIGLVVVSEMVPECTPSLLKSCPPTNLTIFEPVVWGFEAFGALLEGIISIIKHERGE